MHRLLTAIAGVCLFLPAFCLEAGQTAAASPDAAAQWKIAKEKAPLIAEAYLEIQKDIAQVGQNRLDWRDRWEATPEMVAPADLWELLLCGKQAHRAKEGIPTAQALQDRCDYLVCRDRCRVDYSRGLDNCMRQMPDIPEDCLANASEGRDECMKDCRKLPAGGRRQ